VNKIDKVLILGASGLVGKALAEELNKKYEVYGTYSSNKISSIKSIYFNVSEVDSIAHTLNTVKPSKIVYCLRGDFDLQLAVISELVKYLKVVNGKLYFCSTANVFDGDTTKPHFKNDEPIGESDYGKFKIQCEEVLKRGLRDNSIILRLPMIWGKDSPRLNSLAAALNNNEKVDVYTNVYVNKNTDEMLAKQISYIIDNDLKGIFHLGSNEVINYYDFVKKLTNSLGYGEVKFKEEELPVERYYLAVLPDGELPKELNFSNESVICYLTS